MKLKKLWHEHSQPIKFLFRLAVTILFLSIILKKVELHKLSHMFVSLDLTTWLTGLVISIAALVIPAYRFGFLAARLYSWEKKLNYWIILQMQALFYNNVLPGTTGADVSRVLYLSLDKMETGKAAALVILDRAIGFIGTLGVLSGAVLWGKANGVNLPLVVPVKLSLLLAIAAVLILISLVPGVKNYLGKLYPNNPKISSLVYIFILAVIYQSVDIATAFIYGRALGLNINIWYYFLFFPLVYIATVFPISINGLGVREAAITGLFSLVGVGPYLALSISLLIFLDRLLKGMIGLVFINFKSH
ncbi:MAG TPA: lysylphosphatidylglycerol synthase transmembrane domain-containing protein [Syntrophomonadaceae bacterium]|nr:lysylphosphatidylglycerol synthase transmembrane domain-containing protein [Syntrophomonadaceae bacterium]